jgi:hypothetical protein
MKRRREAPKPGREPPIGGASIAPIGRGSRGFPPPCTMAWVL